MVPAPFVVVLDANVLFPFTLRDTLLRAAAAGFYQARWSSQILDEMTRNLVSTETMSEARAQKLRAIMEREFPEADVKGYEPLVAGMQNHEKDRHVVAAAVKAGAQVIATSNLRDFASLPDGVEAQSPDEFLCNLFDLDPDEFVGLLRDQAADLVKPPMTFAELLERLARVVPDVVGAVREHVAGGSEGR
jgi:predicted nucleic acid-binding protein